PVDAIVKDHFVGKRERRGLGRIARLLPLGAQLFGARVGADDGGARLSVYAVGAGMVQMPVRVEEEADGLARALSNQRKDLFCAVRIIGVDDQNVVLEHDPGAVRRHFSNVVALPEEYAWSEFPKSGAFASSGGEDESKKGGEQRHAFIHAAKFNLRVVRG